MGEVRIGRDGWMDEWIEGKTSFVVRMSSMRGRERYLIRVLYIIGCDLFLCLGLRENLRKLDFLLWLRVMKWKWRYRFYI